MSFLDDDFSELFQKIKQTDYLNPAMSDPVFYFVYPPESMLDLKRHFTRWAARFREAGREVVRVSFCDLLWECIEESGRWEEWLEIEPNYDPGQIIKAISDVLAGNNRLLNKILSRIGSAKSNNIFFFTETETLHPYFRTRTIENSLHDKVKIPVVIFYPGSRAGQFGLKFLGFYDEDPNYRSTMIGGL